MEEKEILNIKLDKGYGDIKYYKLYKKDIPNKLAKVLDCLIKGYISQVYIDLSDSAASFKVSHKYGHTKIFSTDRPITDTGTNLFLEEYSKKEDKYIMYEINNNPIVSKYFTNNSKELREDVDSLDDAEIVSDSIQFEGEIIEKCIKKYEEYGIIGKSNIPTTLLKLVNDFSCKDYSIDTLVKIDLERLNEIRYMKFKYEEKYISFNYIEGDNFVTMSECKNIGKNVGYDKVTFYDGRNDNMVSISTTVMREFMKFFIDDRSVFDDFIKSVVTLEN